MCLDVLVEIFPLGSGSVDSHIYPTHCSCRVMMITVIIMRINNSRDERRKRELDKQIKMAERIAKKRSPDR